MNNIIVLGAGMVGSAIAIDLAKTNHITLADFNIKALEKTKNKHNNISIIQMDVTNKTVLKNTLQDFDLVVCAVPGFLGFETLNVWLEDCRK